MEPFGIGQEKVVGEVAVLLSLALLLFAFSVLNLSDSLRPTNTFHLGQSIENGFQFILYRHEQLLMAISRLRTYVRLLCNNVRVVRCQITARKGATFTQREGVSVAKVRAAAKRK